MKMPSSDPEIAARIRALLQAACRTEDLVIKRLLDFLANHGGVPASATAAAAALGFPSRYALARYLNRHSAMTLTELARWTRVLTWLERARRGERHLTRQAFLDELDPSNCRRTVKDLTGLTWREVSAAGVDCALRRLADEWDQEFRRERIDDDIAEA